MSTRIIRCQNCGTKNRIPAGKEHLKPKCGRCGQRITVPVSGTVREVTDTDFERVVLQAELPVLVDFYSPTCGPCHALAPTIDNLASKFAGTVLIAKLDTSRYQMVAARYQIRGVPTLIFFHNGQVVDQLVGAVPQIQIEQKIRSML